eukprot:8218190-Pyramimonas_sp.AAC.1
MQPGSVGGAVWAASPRDSIQCPAPKPGQSPAPARPEGCRFPQCGPGPSAAHSCFFKTRRSFTRAEHTSFSHCDVRPGTAHVRQTGLQHQHGLNT